MDPDTSPLLLSRNPFSPVAPNFRGDLVLRYPRFGTIAGRTGGRLVEYGFRSSQEAYAVTKVRSVKE